MTYLCQDKHLITKHLLFLSSCESPSSPLKPQVAIPFLSSRWYISLNCQACPWISLSLWCPYTNIIKCGYFSPVNLSYINLIIRPVKEPRRARKKFSSPTIYIFLKRVSKMYYFSCSGQNPCWCISHVPLPILQQRLLAPISQ